MQMMRAARLLAAALCFSLLTSAAWPASLPSPIFGNQAGGFINKFRNASFDIWQRGTSVTIGTSGNYGPDGWKIYFTGSSSVTAARSGTSNADNGPLYALEVEGAASNTDIKVGQRIESSVAAPLAGQIVTVQFAYLQNTGSAVTPKISTCYPSAQDNFGTCTADLAATSLASCATAVYCIETYTFQVSGNAVNGYEIDFDCNAAFTSGSLACFVDAADVRVTPGLGNGSVLASPPPPELLAVGVELALCERYYYQLAEPTNGTPLAAATLGIATSSTAANTVIALPVTMRVAPTVTVTLGSMKLIGAGGVALTSLGSPTSTISAVELSAAVASGLTSGNTYFLGGGGGSGLIAFSSEL